MLISTVLSLLLNAQLGAAQLSSTATPSVTRNGTVATTSASGSPSQPCGQVASLSASYAAASPSATDSLQIPYDLMTQCVQSVPINVEDAVDLIDVLSAWLQFQSDLAYKANPPSGYLLAGVDILGELQSLKQAVQSGTIKGEIDFENRIQSIYARAHDGHMAFQMDGLSTFRYVRPYGSLVSVSTDGIQPPKIYFYSEILAYANGTGSMPSAIETINGLNATSFVLQEVQNKTIGILQDPDALYNLYFWLWNSGGDDGDNFPGLFEGYLVDTGSMTSITFENGTIAQNPNYAVTRGNWTGVVDGNSFYRHFCNATVKEAEYSSSLASSKTATATRTAEPVAPTLSASATPTASADSSQLAGYPQPLVISDDGSASGYFLDLPGYKDTAVLALRSMSQTGQDSFQQTVTNFFARCRAANKTRLVLDVQGNGGGSVSLGYDVFKQLFPSITPYGAFDFRAHEGFRLLGESVTPRVRQALQQDPDNITVEVASAYAATTFLNATGQPYQSLGPYYGPYKAPNGYGNYTNLARYNLSNPDYQEAIGGIVISGYANNSRIAPSPFTSDNIILLTDGRCGSTCTIFAHFLKYQGKVKSVVLGGRPNAGPVQAIGGIKGSQVYQFASLTRLLAGLYEDLSDAVLKTWAGTSLDILTQNADYFILRSASAGKDPSQITVNFQNNIAEGDASRTPLQYIYEAADCRMFYTPAHIASIQSIWYDVAANAFGLNGTSKFSRCAAGSTNAPSSLSGNTTLFGNGQPDNVTASTGPIQSTVSKANSASTLSSSFTAGFVALIVAAMI